MPPVWVMHHGHMSHDPPPTWTIAERGSFVVGTCEACGYTSPARRARFTAESDMLAHEILCDSRESAPTASAAGTPTAPAAGTPTVSAAGEPTVTAAGEDEVASGRERLSAQGRS